jgi:hypothetical protein
LLAVRNIVAKAFWAIARALVSVGNRIDATSKRAVVFTAKDRA